MSTVSMSTIRQRLAGFEFKGLGIPFLVLLIMAMLVVPLPPLLLDVLLAKMAKLAIHIDPDFAADVAP